MSTLQLTSVYEQRLKSPINLLVRYDTLSDEESSTEFDNILDVYNYIVNEYKIQKTTYPNDKCYFDLVENNLYKHLVAFRRYHLDLYGHIQNYVTTYQVFTNTKDKELLYQKLLKTLDS